MPDKTFDIVIEIRSQIKDLQDAVNQIKNLRGAASDAATAGIGLKEAFEFAGANEIIRQLTSSIEEIPQKLLEAVKSGVEFNAQVQQVQIGIAAILRQTQDNKFLNFDQANAAAGEYVDLLKQKANELGIVYTDMFESVQHTQAQLASAGVTDINKIIEATVLLNRAMQAVGVSSTQAARDIGDILQGQASRTLGGGRLAPALGFSKEELDEFVLTHIQAGDIVDALRQKMKALGEAVTASSQTFQSDVNRMQNAITDLESEAAKPIMQPLVDSLRDLTGLAADEALKALARTIGDIGAVAIGTGRGIAEVVSQIGALIEKAHVIGALFPGGDLIGASISGYTGKFDLNVQAIQTESLQKQYDLLHKQVLEAKTQEDQDKANVALGQAIEQVQGRILSGQFKNVDAAKSFLENVRWLQQAFTFVAGSVNDIAPHLRETAQQLDAVRSLQNEIARSQAETPEDIASAKAETAYDNALKTLRERKVTQAEFNGEMLTAEQIASRVYDAIYKQTYELEHGKTVQSELNALMREQQQLIERIHQTQQLIAAAPFLSIDARQALTLQSMRQEYQALQDAIAQDRDKLNGGTLDPQTYERVSQEMQKLGFQADLLREKMQSLTFGGELQADLAKWVNGFGTAAHQISGFITGEINSGLQAMNQYLLTGQGNVQQLLLHFAELGLQVLEQMAIQRIASALGITQSTTQAAAAGPIIASAFAVPAALVSVATEGAADVAATAGLAETVSFAQALALFDTGGFTGRGDPNRIAGVVHGQEYVFTADETAALGVPFLQQLAAAAGGSATFSRPPGYQTGGYVFQFNPITELPVDPGTYENSGGIWQSVPIGALGGINPFEGFYGSSYVNPFSGFTGSSYTDPFSGFTGGSYIDPTTGASITITPMGSIGGTPVQIFTDPFGGVTGTAGATYYVDPSTGAVVVTGTGGATIGGVPGGTGPMSPYVPGTYGLGGTPAGFSSTYTPFGTSGLGPQFSPGGEYGASGAPSPSVDPTAWYGSSSPGPATPTGIGHALAVSESAGMLGDSKLGHAAPEDAGAQQAALAAVGMPTGFSWVKDPWAGINASTHAGSWQATWSPSQQAALRSILGPTWKTWFPSAAYASIPTGSPLGGATYVPFTGPSTTKSPTTIGGPSGIMTPGTPTYTWTSWDPMAAPVPTTGSPPGGFPQHLHSGGTIEEVNIVAQVGEHMIQKSASDYYGHDALDLVNNMRIPVSRLKLHDGGEIGSTATGAGGDLITSGGSENPTKIEVYIFHDLNEALNAYHDSSSFSKVFQKTLPKHI